MIREISNELTKTYGKRNWIDQNNVVFGYADNQDCCEEWGWGVWNPQTRELVCKSPNGLPYHFDFARGATTEGFSYGDPPKHLSQLLYGQDLRYLDQLDVVRVWLLPDNEGENEPLIFEAWTHHNGYYLHDFSFEKQNVDDKNDNALPKGELVEASHTLIELPF